MNDFPYILTDELFDLDRPTIIYFHGWMESGAKDLSVQAIRSAYLDRGDHNVISVDWSKYSKNINYRQTVIPQMKVVRPRNLILL